MIYFLDLLLLSAFQTIAKPSSESRAKFSVSAGWGKHTSATRTGATEPALLSPARLARLALLASFFYFFYYTHAFKNHTHTHTLEWFHSP